MGGLFPGKTVIGGLVSAPGIPFSLNPLSGLFSSNNGLGLAVSGVQYFYENAAGFAFGVPPTATGVLTQVTQSPDNGTALTTRLTALVISPNNRLIYTANDAGGTISCYSRNPVTGVISQQLASPFTLASVTRPTAVNISLDGNFLYVTTTTPTPAVRAYSINQTTGVLTFVSGQNIAGATALTGTILNAAGTMLYAADSTTNSVYAVPVNGGVLGAPTTNACADAINLALSADGRFLYVARSVSNTSYRVMAVNAALLTEIVGSPFTPSGGVTVQAFSPHPSVAGKMYAALSNGVSLNTVNADGSLTQTNNYPTASTVWDLVVSPDGKNLYANVTGSLYSYLASSADGTLTAAPGSPFAFGPSGVQFSLSLTTDSQYMYALTAAVRVAGYGTSATVGFQLLTGVFDPSGGSNGYINIPGSLYVGGQLVNTASSPSANPILNGEHMIDQVNQGAAYTVAIGSTASVTYLTDGHYAWTNGATIQAQQTFASIGEFWRVLQLNGAGGVTQVGYGTRIESSDSAPLSSSRVTWSAYVNNLSALTNVTVNIYRANALDNWGAKTLVSSGVISLPSGIGRISYTFDIGTEARFGVAVELVFGALTANSVAITGEKIETGSVPTAYAHVPPEAELIRCQRQVYPLFPTNAALAWQISRQSTTTFAMTVDQPLNMRAVPSIVLAGAGPYGRLNSYDTNFAQILSNVTAIAVIAGSTANSVGLLFTHGAVAGTQVHSMFDSVGSTGLTYLSARL